jgi:hypothetical protein
MFLMFFCWSVLLCVGFSESERDARLNALQQAISAVAPKISTTSETPTPTGDSTTEASAPLTQPVHAARAPSVPDQSKEMRHKSERPERASRGDDKRNQKSRNSTESNGNNAASKPAPITANTEPATPFVGILSSMLSQTSGFSLKVASITDADGKSIDLNSLRQAIELQGNASSGAHTGSAHSTAPHAENRRPPHKNRSRKHE